ncbi:MAG TPA: RNA methyltransferase [Bacteroidales bacterium]
MRKLLNSELNRLDQKGFKDADKLQVVVILDNIRSQHNIGSVFRTADAFRIERILLCGITATPPNREMQKTALGATETVAWEYFENTLQAIDQMRKAGYTIIAIEQVEGSLPLENFYPCKFDKIALVFGNEVHGVNEVIVKEADESIEIPQFGTKHSLNISVTAGIVLWHVFQHLRESIKF